MRKAYKKLIVAAISLCVIGTLAFIIGMSIIGWDFYRLTPRNTDRKSVV